MKSERRDVVIRPFKNGVWDGTQETEQRVVYTKADGSHWMGSKVRVAPNGDRFVFEWQIREIREIKAHTIEEIFGK